MASEGCISVEVVESCNKERCKAESCISREAKSADESIGQQNCKVFIADLVLSLHIVDLDPVTIGKST